MLPKQVGCRGCWRGLRRGHVATASNPRSITTGESYSYRPGRIARGLRAIFTLFTPSTVKQRIAIRMKSGMEKAEQLEREQLWLRTHGSPLQLMGLPDHAELTEVRARYRHLILETHPDTAAHGNKLTSRNNNTSDYALLQTAYSMATTPGSLWHRNGSAPQLYEQLVKTSRIGRVRGVTVFAVFSYIIMALVGLFFSCVLVQRGLELALQLFDPEFFSFMRKQEEDERRRREAGEVVNTDPKRLAPTALRKLLFPGQYIHNTHESSE